MGNSGMSWWVRAHRVVAVRSSIGITRLHYLGFLGKRRIHHGVKTRALVDLQPPRAPPCASRDIIGYCMRMACSERPYHHGWREKDECHIIVFLFPPTCNCAYISGAILLYPHRLTSLEHGHSIDGESKFILRFLTVNPPRCETFDR